MRDLGVTPTGAEASLEKPTLSTGVVSADLADEVERSMNIGKLRPVRVILLCQQYRRALDMIANLEVSLSAAKAVEGAIKRQHEHDIRELRELAKLEDQRD